MKVNHPPEALLLSLHFIESQHGWSVGADGTLLLTTDGGITGHTSDCPASLSQYPQKYAQKYAKHEVHFIGGYYAENDHAV